MHAPCPKLVIIGWAASPSRVTGPSPHCSRNGLSRAGKAEIASIGVASTAATTSGAQPA